MRRHRLGAAALSALVLTGATACSGGGTEAVAVGPAALGEAGTFRVCTDMQYPPMAYFANGTSGKELGFDPDMSRAIAKEWGVDVKILNTPFVGTIPALEAGRCDAILSAMYINDDRLKAVNAIPYLSSGTALAVKKGATKPASLADIAGKTVGVVAGGAIFEQLQETSKQLQSQGLAPLKIATYPAGKEFAAVISGKADFAADADVRVSDAVARSQELEQVDGIIEGTPRFGVWVKPGNKLAEDLVKAIKTIATNGTGAEIAKQDHVNPANLIAPDGVESA